MRPFFTPEREPCWLLLDASMRRDDAAVLRSTLPDYARAYHDDLDAWQIDHDWDGELRDALGHAKRSFCAACAKGGICAAWQRVGTHAAGYRTRAPKQETYAAHDPPPTSAKRKPGFFDFDQPERWQEIFEEMGFGLRVESDRTTVDAAAVLLGVDPKATREQIQLAFKAKALAAHPDRGGTDAAMRELIKARDAMFAALS